MVRRKMLVCCMFLDNHVSSCKKRQSHSGRHPHDCEETGADADSEVMSRCWCAGPCRHATSIHLPSAIDRVTASSTFWFSSPTSNPGWDLVSSAIDWKKSANWLTKVF